MQISIQQDHLLVHFGPFFKLTSKYNVTFITLYDKSFQKYCGPPVLISKMSQTLSNRKNSLKVKDYNIKKIFGANILDLTLTSCTGTDQMMLVLALHSSHILCNLITFHKKFKHSHFSEPQYSNLNSTLKKPRYGLRANCFCPSFGFSRSASLFKLIPLEVFQTKPLYSFDCKNIINCLQ